MKESCCLITLSTANCLSADLHYVRMIKLAIRLEKSWPISIQRSVPLFALGD